MTASDQQVSPEARLAAALLAALKDTGYLLTHEYADSGVIDVGDAMVRADPTLAADLALAAAVRRHIRYHADSEVTRELCETCAAWHDEAEAAFMTWRSVQRYKAAKDAERE